MEPETGEFENKGAGLVDGLQSDVGASARVEDFYGGVRIRILDPGKFPWQKVLERLLERQNEVWVRMGREGMEIVTQSVAS